MVSQSGKSIIAWPIGSVNQLYTRLIRWLLKVAEKAQLSIRAIITTFDLLERYLAHYSVIRADLGRLGVTMVCTSFKLTDVGNYFSNLFDSKFVFDGVEIIFDQIRPKELTVIAELNYTLVSCGIDDYVSRLLDLRRDLNETYQRLRQNYQLIADDGRYSGAMTYDRIIDYLSVQ